MKKLAHFVGIIAFPGFTVFAQMPPGPGGNPCTNCPPATNTYISQPYAPGLKVSVSELSGTNFYLNLLEADPDGVYSIYYASNLTDASWQTVTQGVSGQSDFALTLPQPETGFFRAARTDTPVTNTADMAISFPGYDVNSNLITAIVSGGPAAAMAVLVDDTNFADARWVPFSAIPYVLLGTNDGTYDIEFGFIGSDGQTNWVSTSVILDTTPPVLTITNPVGNVSEPLIQIQGDADEALSSLTFDVSNAAGIFTNQTGYVTEQFYDTNLMAFTGCSFQCYDVSLTNGENSITIYATDLAGNVTITNFNVTVDYSGVTTGPTLTPVWPADGTVIATGAGVIALEAKVNDPSAKVTVTISDDYGDTNTMKGIVERDGTVWAQNLPLLADTNTITLIAVNAAGYTNQTTFTTYWSYSVLEMYPLTSDQLNQSSVTVWGYASDSNVDVYVNGVEAYPIDDEGDWVADDVPVSATGMAVFDLEVYGQGGSENLKRPSFFHPKDLPEGASLYSLRDAMSQPSQVILSAYHEETKDVWYTEGCADSGDCSISRTVDWKRGIGGYSAQHSVGYPYGSFDGECESYVAWPADWPEGQTLEGESCEGDYSESPNPAWQFSAIFNQVYAYSGPFDECQGNFHDSYTLSRTVNTTIELAAGENPQSQSPRLILLQATAAEYEAPDADYWNPTRASDGPWNPFDDGGDIPLPPSAIRILDQSPVISENDTNVGEWLVSESQGSTLDIVPKIAWPLEQNHYSFNVQASDVELQLAVDANRDGDITFDNADQTGADNPYRFWINDSQESGDISSADDQIPGSSSPNDALNQVNGRSDLVNFFPVALSLSNVLQWLPLTNGFEYHLSQADNAVKFVYTSLTPDDAFDYLTNLTSYGYGINADEFATNADVDTVSSDGVTLDTNWLATVQDNGGKGIILLEGRAASTAPLRLEIWHNDQKMGSVSLHLSLSGVEQMYRHKNLRDGSDAPSGLVGDTTVRDNDPSLATSMSEPQNNPDIQSDGGWFIFVVGSNVGGQNARGWESEVFKRMYWSGSKAKFVGVSWYGDPYTNSEGVYDYHMAVRNAFVTSPALASFVNGLSGGKTIAGHSLGCGLIASAIADDGMNVNNACLMDAAIAQESFDGDADDSITAMVPSAWQGYPTNLWAAHWHELFNPSDARSTLTWRNRFAGALTNGANIYNFYSSTEDVLGEYDGDVPTTALDAVITDGGNFEAYVWTYQEKAKGDRQNYYVPFFGNFHVGSTYGGWGFNIFDGYLTNYPIWYIFDAGLDDRRIKLPSDIGTVTQALLDGSRYNPLFKTGWGGYDIHNPQNVDVDTNPSDFTGPSWILDLYDPVNGSTVASDTVKRNQLLAEVIPALSMAVGSHSTSRMNANFNMPVQFVVNADKWPRGKQDGSGIALWHHSDMGQIAFPYTYGLYDKLVSIVNQ